MRSLAIVTICMSLFSCTTVRHSPQQLIQMELNRSKAIEFHDSTVLSDMYASDFSGVAAGGVAVDKPLLMSIFKKHTNDLIFVNDDHVVRFIDKKTAVLTGRLTAKDKDHHVVSISRYSHVLSFRDGKWQIIYGQGTVIPLN